MCNGSHWKWLGIFLISLLVLGCGRGKPAQTPLSEATRLVGKGDYPAAIAACDEVLAKKPNDYDALVLRGQANTRHEQVNEAIADLTKAIEVAPDRPDAYRWRYRIYMELAKVETDIQNKTILEQAAAADHKNLTRFDPNASMALKKSFTAPPSYLNQPVPGSESEENDQFAVQGGVPSIEDSVNDRSQPKREWPSINEEKQQPEFGKLDDGTRAPEQPNTQEPSPKAKDQPASDQVAADQLAADEEEIIRRELDEEVEEPTLPPHEADLPKRALTRFDRQAFVAPPQGSGFGQSSSFVPQTRSRATTGISQPSSQNNANALPQSRFFLQNQVGSNFQQGNSGIAPRPFRSTGISSTPTPFTSSAPINNGRSTGLISSGRLSPSTARNQGIPAGFLSPTAQASFGPRIGVAPFGPNANNNGSLGGAKSSPAGQSRDPSGGNPTPQNRPASGPILTTALPGTTVVYGSLPGRAQTSPQYAPALSDPDYTPFVPRQRGVQTTPDLPPQQ